MATPIIATIGTFDGVHLGHQALLAELGIQAERLGLNPAIVTFDPIPSKVLGSSQTFSLLSTTTERVTLLRSLGFKHIILLNFTPELAHLSAKDFMYLLRDKYHVQALLLGYDHRFGRGGKDLSFEDYKSLGKDLGLEVLRAEPMTLSDKLVSSSYIRRYLLEGNIEGANTYLGRSYSLSGQIVGGMQIGRSLGYPTANIKVNEEKLIPQDGVYAVYVLLEHCTCRGRYTRYGGMLYIGDRPTLAEGLSRTIEVNIFDFSANLYAQEIRIEFIAYIRPNIKFSSLGALQEQIGKDEQDVRHTLAKSIQVKL